jgi:hypothetical protein
MLLMTNLSPQPVQIARVDLDFQGRQVVFADLSVRSPESDVFGDFQIDPDHTAELSLVVFLTAPTPEGDMLVGSLTVQDQLGRCHTLEEMQFRELRTEEG